MQNLAKIIALSSILSLCGCGKSPAPQRATPPSTTSEVGEPSNPAFIGKIWMSATPGNARGSILIFLPDRTLLMDSCFETYRISKWGAAGDTIRWVEDSIPIEAQLSMPRSNELRLQIAGQEREQHYVAASAPYVCPDMPK